MASFSQGDVVKVPFPCTDRSTRQSRPALVVSSGGIEDTYGLLWVVMITSAANRRWRTDVAIAEPAEVGLPAPSVIRPAKIATIDAGAATRLGRVPDPVLSRVLRNVLAELGAARPPK